ncbi:hypothetical protein WJX73_006099 [Symbiochloris irregularis]|uniref:Uncharacterized protein n=1 Tax=Symbiochloris irregularis TaxID=706552 RepID=A0AAW1PN16_9CHLO
MHRGTLIAFAPALVCFPALPSSVSRVPPGCLRSEVVLIVRHGGPILPCRQMPSGLAVARAVKRQCTVKHRPGTLHCCGVLPGALTKLAEAVPGGAGTVIAVTGLADYGLIALFRDVYSKVTSLRGPDFGFHMTDFPDEYDIPDAGEEYDWSQEIRPDPEVEAMIEFIAEHRRSPSFKGPEVNLSQPEESKIFMSFAGPTGGLSIEQLREYFKDRLRRVHKWDWDTQTEIED